MRLSIYDRLKSEDEEEKKSAILSLKQVWMDTVDMKRGNTAIKLMAQQFQYVTLIDAFMAAESPEKVKDLDLNDRVMRILSQRIGEFFDWVKISEKELRKRFEIEKIYLKSQVNTVKLYARWAKPYLRAAVQLEQRVTSPSSEINLMTSSAALVTAFNTSLFELTLLCQSEYKPDKDIDKGDLPAVFRKAKKRNYAPIMITELRFRSIPERTQQGGYGFRGRVEMLFTGYALNEDELRVLRRELANDDVNDLYKMVENATEESLRQMADDLNEFIEDDEKKKNEKKEEKKEKKSDDTNPFSAILSFLKFSDSDKPNKGDGEIPPDTHVESVMRSQAIIKSRKECYKIYSMYKKAHGMPSY